MITKEIDNLRYFESVIYYYCREAGYDIHNNEFQASQRSLNFPFVAIKGLINEELHASLGFVSSWFTWNGGSLVASTSGMVLTSPITSTITWRSLE